MAARRERDRRRPSGERRYRFATPEPAVEAEEIRDDGESVAAVEPPPSTHSRPARHTRDTPAPASTRKQFSAYKDEYAYVYGDLRRVGVVIGSLLAILIILYFVLPNLVH
jgi:hypothetical protein